MATPKLVTEELISGEALYEMSDVERSELVEGRIVEMSPTKPQHGRVESRLDYALLHYVREHNTGVVMVGEVGIYTGRNPDTVRAADVLYISHERLAKATPNSFLDVAPQLIVEILSPSDRWSEVRRMVREYFDAGVDVVVLVEPEARLVAVYRAATKFVELTVGETLTLEEILPGFSLPLSELFDP